MSFTFAFGSSGTLGGPFVRRAFGLPDTSMTGGASFFESGMSLSSASASVIGASGNRCYASAEYFANSASSSSTFSGVAVAVLPMEETEDFPYPTTT